VAGRLSDYIVGDRDELNPRAFIVVGRDKFLEARC
jgi:hypothetical protein